MIEITKAERPQRLVQGRSQIVSCKSLTKKEKYGRLVQA